VGEFEQDSVVAVLCHTELIARMTCSLIFVTY